MIIDCAYYRDGHRQHVGAMSIEDAAERCRQDGFVWLGLFDPTTAELEQASRCFGLHELAVEDAQTFHLRPKVEPYEGDIRLVILRTARYDDEREEVDFGEVSVFVGPAFVITVRQGVASELHGAAASAVPADVIRVPSTSADRTALRRCFMLPLLRMLAGATRRPQLDAVPGGRRPAGPWSLPDPERRRHPHRAGLSPTGAPLYHL